MLLNYVLRQGYQVLKRYVLLFLALIPYILTIIPQININISSIPRKAMIVFVVLHIILIYGRTLFTYSLLQTTLHLLRFLFHHPKRKENSLCIFPVPGTGNAQRLYRSDVEVPYIPRRARLRFRIDKPANGAVREHDHHAAPEQRLFLIQ